MDSSVPGKRGYHHGDLRNALIEAAAELAAKGGPRSVTIRAAAREAGVTPTAAYRHFAGHEELLTAAKQRALDALTETMRVEVEARSRPTGDPVQDALVRFGAIGRGYLAFALAEPGLFRTVFSPDSLVLPPPEERNGSGPFTMLVAAVDELVRIGYLSRERRPMAEFVAWSTIHGLATLFDGPLRDLPEDMRDQTIVRSMIVLGHGFKGTGLTPEQEKLLSEQLTARR
ncbi:TetR/AcrR family transcriptional regulator [Actinophytocola oryzae]|uniref:TetR family transcriptional regulator n=1 Tax=Actinophytocola oryzae TaxID=502181 RepID=A0A4R7V893_9PSEU|nr:TetR/AcrR family transcriptional regulator [Actinophytocola oryzae]TDV44895.1 TetR family transcriptional regulator [Actinophytocola oryzae]